MTQTEARIPVVVVLGPTASGKTALAVHLAREFGGEIINQDSRQVFRGMDIGTAKPTAEERRLAPHHGLDLVSPGETWTLAEQQRLTYETVRKLQRAGRLPLLVGGTGQYLRAVLEGWTVPEVPPDAAFREELANEATLDGVSALYARLREIDPPAADKIMPNDLRRITRALEVWHATGVRISDQQRATPPPYNTLLLGLTMDRSVLYNRIDRRVQRMLESGLLGEIEWLLAAGYSWELPALQTIGYGEFQPYWEGKAGIEECAERVRYDTHRFARHQYIWFRRFDAVEWLDASEPEYTDHARRRIEQWLSNVNDLSHGV